MTNGTQKARRFRSTRPDLWYFDQLPPPLRSALANAKFKWASGAVYREHRRGESISAIVQEIEDADARIIERDRTKVWGEKIDLSKIDPSDLLNDLEI